MEDLQFFQTRYKAIDSFIIKLYYIIINSLAAKPNLQKGVLVDTMRYTADYFDAPLDRRGSGSTKWDGCCAKFGVEPSANLIPMWIADMDFRSPREVIEAVVHRASFGSFGYSAKTDAFYHAIVSWVERRYHWKVERDWIVFTPGVIPGFNIAVQRFTKPGEGVIVQPPVYYPFMEAAQNNGRLVVENPLIERDGDWFMNFEDLEQKARDPANKVLILCNPHNPVGRAWTAEELQRLSQICLENQVLLLSDEIHADLMMGQATHHAACAAVPEMRNHSITQYAPSKTFNLAGLQTAFAVIPDPELRAEFERGVNANRIFNLNWFSTAALEAAYTQCDDYVTALCRYISNNMDYMQNFLATRLPMLKMKKPEATYMVWVDFRGTGMTTAQIERFIVEDARIGVDMGSWFGASGAGYLRFNLACTRSLLEQALNRLEKALTSR